MRFKGVGIKGSGHMQIDTHTCAALTLIALVPIVPILLPSRSLQTRREIIKSQQRNLRTTNAKGGENVRLAINERKSD